MTRKRESTSSKAASSKKAARRAEESKTEIGGDADPINGVSASPAKADSLKKCKTTGPKSPAGGKKVISIDIDQKSPVKAASGGKLRVHKDDEDEPEAKFIGDPVPDEEARQRWPKRYQEKKQKRVTGSKSSKDKDDSDEIIQARRHYTRAEVDGCVVYDLYDDAHVKAEDGEESYICKIVEMFEAVDGKPYFTARWFYRAKDTVIKNLDHLIDKKRVFFSEIQDDNPLDCLVGKLRIARIPLNVDLDAKKDSIPVCNYYYDMLYLLPYSTFVNLPPDNTRAGSETSSTISSDVDVNETFAVKSDYEEVSQVRKQQKSEVILLDLYSGCGAMSTGLCLGANLSGLNLVTKWAVDLNKHACDSLKLNHPLTEVRNESVEDFLSLLKEWEKLCISFSLIKSKYPQQEKTYLFGMKSDEDGEDDDDGSDDGEDDSEVFEVENILAICYGDPKENGKRGLYFKVRWKGYGVESDSWEPIDGLGNCRESMKNFVTNGYKSKILPLPGDVDVVCGGPPCQGISGFNRFRNKDSPLDDEKNKQLVVFMEVVEYLKPRFVLMENVVDIVKFSNGFLGRYALGRLIDMNYQTRMGMMAAGAYGLPQFRMRVFLWGARPNEKLPQYPLPTHDLVVRGVIPVEFEMNTVAYDEGQKIDLERKLLLEDAISDLPAIENDEHRDEMPYHKDPQSVFQRFIRLTKDEMLGASVKSHTTKQLLYDHRPLELNTDDYQRVCRIPKKKGANFRDLPGVRVRPDNKVEWEPDVKRVYLDSGKPLVPDYAMTFVNGSSSKPFARLWWDETVPTVVTRAEPHNQAILHPEQDRVLSVRENARLQGFPDYYQLCGPVKERYIQVGNAVAVPVSRALGYSLGQAILGGVTDEPLLKLPSKFPNILKRPFCTSSDDEK